MSKISLKFVHRHGRFSLCALVSGTAVRHYRSVTELKNPNFSTWDPVLQRFISHSTTDLNNNKILSAILAEHEALLRENDFANGRELFNYQKQRAKFSGNLRQSNDRSLSVIASTVSHSDNLPDFSSDLIDDKITLEDWLWKIINDIKNPTRLKPSASYQGYLTLVHKLEEEGNLLKQPVSSLNDDSYVSLIRWLNNPHKKGGKSKNYIGIMKIFTATINRARKARLTTYHPEFPYMDYAPVHKITDNARDFLMNGGAIKSLTKEQYEQFLSMDLESIAMHGGVKMRKFKELYRDFCILLYELKSRPIDVLRLHWNNIAYDNNTGRFSCTYIPAKKKNYGASSRHTSKALVIQYLSEDAKRIILKYQGQSKGGYIFPFAVNERQWNFDNPEDFHAHYYKGNHTCGRINKFLHKAGEKMGLPFQLTLYAFRRSAITHAIIENKMPLAMIAKTAGTSIQMIEEHYANYLHALASY